MQGAAAHSKAATQQRGCADGCAHKNQLPCLQDVPRTVSTTDEWVLRQKSFLEGCKVREGPQEAASPAAALPQQPCHQFIKHAMAGCLSGWLAGWMLQLDKQLTTGMLCFILSQLLPYTAACPASYPYQCLTRVVLGDGHLFAALWEGKGGAQAARHCVSACYDVVLGMMQAGEEPSTALEKAFQQLDESYLASDLPDVVRAVVAAAGKATGQAHILCAQTISCSGLCPRGRATAAGAACTSGVLTCEPCCGAVCLQVKAGVGATGTMLLLDTRSNRCHIARLGKSMPFATATKGAPLCPACQQSLHTIARHTAARDSFSSQLLSPSTDCLPLAVSACYRCLQHGGCGGARSAALQQQRQVCVATCQHTHAHMHELTSIQASLCSCL